MHFGRRAELSSPGQLEPFCNDIWVDKCKHYVSHPSQMFESIYISNLLFTLFYDVSLFR